MAKTQSGGACKNPKGFKTGHVGFGRCHLHRGASENGNKAAARAQVMAMASEADAKPSEVLLKAVRCDLTPLLSPDPMTTIELVTTGWSVGQTA